MLRTLAGVAVYVAFFAVLLLIPSHALHAPRAWILLAVLAVLRVGMAIALFRINPALARERRKVIHPGQPLADRVLLAVWMSGFAVVIAVAGADGLGPRRWGAPPPLLADLGLALFAAGWVLIAHVLTVNAYAVTVVRHQPDRQHQLVDQGAYRFVRHPMYAAMTVVVVGMCLWLESWFALVISFIPLAALLGRIALEEPVLRQALPGYADYARRVRYRVVPGLW